MWPIQGDSGVEALLRGDGPLDSFEQERIIADIKAQAIRQAETARWTFRLLYITIAGLFLFVLFHSVLYPFEMSHQRVFRHLLPQLFFHCYYISMVVVFVIGGFAIDKGFSVIPRWIKAIALLLCVVFTVSWAYIFYYWHVTEPILYWLPLTPLACFGLAIFVDRDSESLLTDATALNKYKYDFKKA